MTWTWKKLGRIFDPAEVMDRPWLREFAQAPNTLIFDDFVRVYFSCRPPKDESGQYVSYSAYLDLDRADLTKVLRIAEKPILELGGLGEFDEFGTYPVSVIRDGKFILAYYAGWTRCVSVRFNVAVGLAISKDEGKTFLKCGRGPVLAYSRDEPYMIGSMKIRRFGDVLYLFYAAGRKWKVVNGRTEPVYKIRAASSREGIFWNKLHRDLIPSRIEEDEAQSGPDVIRANGKYHMFFCYRRSADYRGKEGGLRTGYASSDNLIDWTRDDSKAGIDVSETGWDSEMVRYPHVFELDGKTWMLYNGNDFGRNGIGLAVLEGEL